MSTANNYSPVATTEVYPSRRDLEAQDAVYAQRLSEEEVYRAGYYYRTRPYYYGTWSSARQRPVVIYRDDYDPCFELWVIWYVSYSRKERSY